MNRGKETFFFNFLYKFFGIIDWKRHWKIILDTDLDPLYLLNESGLDLHPNNISGYKIYLTLLQTGLTFGF